MVRPDSRDIRVMFTAGDYGQARTTIVDETKSNFPLLAIANETTQSSFLCVAEEGSSYATVQADISGKNNGYNYGTFIYSLIHGENMDVSTKSDTTVRVYEDGRQMKHFPRDTFSLIKPIIRIWQKEYRGYLQKKYPSLGKVDSDKQALAVEMIGAVDDTEHILGYPVVRSQSLTSYTQAKSILEDLQKAGIGNINAKYTGWFNTGVKQTSVC